jgi:hypothetical protein
VPTRARVDAGANTRGAGPGAPSAPATPAAARSASGPALPPQQPRCTLHSRRAASSTARLRSQQSPPHLRERLDAHTARHDAATGRAPVAAALAAPGCGSASGSERRRLRAIADAEPSPGWNRNPAAPAPATVPSPSPSPSLRERKTWPSCDSSGARRSLPAAPCAPGVGAEEVRPKPTASSSGLSLCPYAPRSSASRAWRGSGAGSDRRSLGWEGRLVAAVPEGSHEDFRRA